MENIKLQKVTLTKAFRKNKISKKSGKPYVSLSLLTVEYGDRWINGFGNQSNEGWNDGNTVEIEVYEKEWNGVMNLNFNTPRVNLAEELNKLIVRVEALERSAGLAGAPIVEGPDQGLNI